MVLSVWTDSTYCCERRTDKYRSNPGERSLDRNRFRGAAESDGTCCCGTKCACRAGEKRRNPGFTGNVFLKAVEGLGKFVKKSLKESLFKNIFSKIAAIPALPAMNRFSKVMDYKSYGGALFLGVKKPVVKAHGSSDEKLFEYTIIQAEKFVENKAVDKMIEEFKTEN